MDNRTSNYTNLSTSVSTPIEYYKILILQRLNDLNEAWEFYSKQKHNGIASSLNVVHARSESLFNALSPYLERKLPPQDYKNLKKQLFEIEASEEQLRDIFYIINRQLDLDRITRMDTKNTYDSSRVEIENEESGL